MQILFSSEFHFIYGRCKYRCQSGYNQTLVAENSKLKFKTYDWAVFDNWSPQPKQDISVINRYLIVVYLVVVAIPKDKIVYNLLVDIWGQFGGMYGGAVVVENDRQIR